MIWEVLTNRATKQKLIQRYVLWVKILLWGFCDDGTVTDFVLHYEREFLDSMKEISKKEGCRPTSIWSRACL
jgi:hypothetical protein